MKMESFDDLLATVRSDRDARTAERENALRREMAKAFHAARERKGLSVRGLAKVMGTSVSQVQRLLHEEAGGSLTLRTVCRAADCLDLAVSMYARTLSEGGCTVVPFGIIATWNRSAQQPEASAEVVAPVAQLSRTTIASRRWATGAKDSGLVSEGGGVLIDEAV